MSTNWGGNAKFRSYLPYEDEYMLVISMVWKQLLDAGVKCYSKYRRCYRATDGRFLRWNNSRFKLCRTDYE